MPDTREEHLEWCRQRALEYVDADDPVQAYASMSSDLRKHPETEGLISRDLLERGQQAALTGSKAVREWVESIR